MAELLRKGATYDEIHNITKIDKWFIDKIAHLVQTEQALKEGPLTKELLAEAKRMEFPDKVIAGYTGSSEEEVRAMRLENGITASFKMVDTCAAEFEASTPYYYSVFGSECEVKSNHDRKRSWFLDLVRFVLDRVSNSTSVPFTVYGLFPTAVMKPSLLITTRRQ